MAMNGKILRGILLLLIAIWGNAGLAEEISFTQYRTKDGLSFNNVDCLAEDDEGLIYACTNLGLNVFDGTTFKVFNQYNTTGFANKVSHVAPIERGFVLVGTAEKGLFVYDKYNEKIVSLCKAFNFPAFSVTTTVMDKQRQIWIGGEDGKLYCIDSHELVLAIQENRPILLVPVLGLPLARVNAIVALDKEILVGLDNGEVLRVRKSGSDFIIDRPLLFKDVTCVYSIFKKNKALFIGTEKGIFRIEDSEEMSYNREIVLDLPFCLNGVIVRTLVAHEKFLWAGTEGHGLFKIPLETYLQEKIEQISYSIDKRNGINSNYILATLVDSSDNLWVGTWFGGINQLSLGKRNYYFVYNQENENDIFSNIIWTLAERSEHDYWVGTHGNGLCRYPLNKSCFQQVKYSPELHSISALFQTKDGTRLYIGTWGNGIKLYDTKLMRESTAQEKRFSALSDDRIYAFVADPEENLWIGTFYNGLQRFNVKKQKLEAIDLGEDGIDIRFILLDADKHLLWVASLQNGLYRLECSSEWDVNQVVHYQTFAGESERLKPEALFLDENAQLWVLSRDGVGYYDELERKAYKLDVLRGNITTGMAKDAYGNIWVSTYKGVYKMNSQCEEIEGMLTDYAFHSITYNTKQNKLLATSDEGIVCIDPENEMTRGTYPRILLTSLKVLDQEVNPGQYLENELILPKRLNYCDTITIPHFSHTFSIDLNTLFFSKASREKISYKLEGFEEVWNTQTGKSATAVYTNVPPGAYCFKVKAANEYNLWSGERRLVLIKEKPWWGTHLAWSVYVLIVAGIIYWIVREINIRVKIRQELKIERIKQEREHELYQQKAVFFTNISHDLRTPLTLIIGPLEEMLQTRNYVEKTEATLQRMLKNARMLLGLINQILDFRKAETNNLQLDLKQIELNHFLHYVYSQFCELASQKQIDLELSVSEEPLSLIADPQKLESILFNLLSNAIKFTPSYGSILLESRVDSGTVTIRVCDTGKGIDAEDIPTIFNRFYQLKPSGKSTGTGIGLNLVKRYMELHGGTIEVQSSREKGSRFILSFPQSGNESYELFSFHHDDTTAEGESITNGDTNSQKREPVLVVIDDHQDILDYLKDILSQSYRVYTALNGKDGLSLVAQKHPDLVISDIMMEDMDGLMVCKKIKSSLNSSHIPIILLTAKNALEDRIEGFDSGADEYIEKPFNSKLLLTRVRTLIEHRELIKRRFLLSDLKNTEVAPSSVDEKFMKQVVELIEAHINDSDFTVQSLVDEMKVSQDQLYRKIKALTGLSINHFIRLLRLKRAAKMLSSGNFTVSEVVFQTGFNNPSYFTKCFKSEYGVLPSEYMQHKKNNEF